MTRKQCSKCKKGCYKDGMCYADVKKGRPVSYYSYCWAATPENSLKNTKSSIRREFVPLVDKAAKRTEDDF